MILATAGSIPFGPAIPNGEFDTISIPTSRKVGASGQFLLRAAVHRTSSRSCPAFTSDAQPVASATASTCPPSKAPVVSDVPLKGTCVHLMPCCFAICSMVMCRLVPAPGVP